MHLFITVSLSMFVHSRQIIIEAFKVMNNALQTVSPGVWYDTVLATVCGGG